MQRTVTGTLEDIADRVAEANLRPPAIIVIGDVVALREAGLDWYERRPLFGRRVVVTRARAQAGELSGALERLGAEVLEFPTIEVRPPDDFGPLDAAIRELDTFGLAHLHERQRRRRVRETPRPPWAGPAGRAEGRQGRGHRSGHGREGRGGRPAGRRGPARVQGRGPGRGSDGGRARWEAGPYPEGPCGARDPAREAARGRRRGRGPAGLRVRPVRSGERGSRPAARGTAGWTASPSPPARRSRTSSGRSARRRRGGLLAGTRVACIGPITADTARGHGIRVDAEAREYTIPGLVEAVADLFVADPAQRGE